MKKLIVLSILFVSFNVFGWSGEAINLDHSNSEHIIEYSVCVSDYEKIERLDNGVVQNDKEIEERTEPLLNENG